MPKSRGRLSAYLLDRLSAAPEPSQDPPPEVRPGGGFAGEGDWEDLHLALYLCYELHYLGVEGADARWEWEPSLLEFRRSLEARFEEELLELAPSTQVLYAEVEERLNEIAGRKSEPSLSRYMAEEATLAQFKEFVVHRSLYHLKEADPHSWAIPRLHGKPKGALIEIQADEYGGGREPWMHSSLYRKLMQQLDLESGYGAYLDAVPAATLSSVNLMSMFGLHRRWRGALVGHLALFEMTSSGPNRLYGDGLRRLGFGEDATHFYDEHVEADSLHETIAVHDLAAGLAAQQPELASDIVFGAECLAALDARVASRLLLSWQTGSTSLLQPLEPAGFA